MTTKKKKIKYGRTCWLARHLSNLWKFQMNCTYLNLDFLINTNFQCQPNCYRNDNYARFGDHFERALAQTTDSIGTRPDRRSELALFSFYMQFYVCFFFFYACLDNEMISQAVGLIVYSMAIWLRWMTTNWRLMSTGDNVDTVLFRFVLFSSSEFVDCRPGFTVLHAFLHGQIIIYCDDERICARKCIRATNVANSRGRISINRLRAHVMQCSVFIWIAVATMPFHFVSFHRFCTCNFFTSRTRQMADWENTGSSGYQSSYE